MWWTTQHNKTSQAFDKAACLQYDKAVTSKVRNHLKGHLKGQMFIV